jgi:hypothetical protein
MVGLALMNRAAIRISQSPLYQWLIVQLPRLIQNKSQLRKPDRLLAGVATASAELGHLH